MDITVSIADHTSLSSSEVIRRKLYSSVQIGNTCHAGSGVLIDGAKFRSGTVENPLVLTVRNSQTESVMYVRNVPISAVLERGGLEQWVAVYPPGDPQNYHFDAAAPAAGPRLRLSVAVREDEAGGAAGAAAGAAAAPPGPSPFRPPRRAAGGAPAGAEEGETGDASNWPRHSLDRSGAEPFVDCPQPALLAQQLDVPGQGERGPPWVLRASTGEAGIGGGLDGSFRLKAQRLKEHVAEVASAAKRAQDVTRNLQESLRIRDDLRRQLQGLGEEIATQQAAAHCLERELGKLRAEDAQLKEQISQRNAAFQGLRDNRDGIDRELSRALSEGQRRRGEMDTSSLEFAQQRQAMTNEIEHSKLHVSRLTVSLKNKEEVVAESHRKAREALQAAISQARADLAGARATLEEQHRACGRLDARRGEAMERFMGLQGASASAGAAARDRPSHRAADAGADLESRRGKIQAQLSRARKLGEELDEKRGQVERMGARAADLHAEARERDLAASRCREARAELERQLEERRASALPPREQLLASGGQLARAEQEAQRALEALAVLGPGAPGAPGGAPEAPGGAPAAPAPELAAGAARERLERGRGELGAQGAACEGLEATARGALRRARDSRAALEAARGRAAELAQGLAAAGAAGGGGALRRLAQDLASRSARLDEARGHARQRQRELRALREEERAARAGGRAAALEASAEELRAEAERLRAAGRSAGARRRELEDSAAAGRHSLRDLQGEIDGLLEDRRGAEEEAGAAARRAEARASELRSRGDELAGLEALARAREADLDATSGRVASKLRTLAEMERAYGREAEELGALAAWLCTERAEAETVSARLSTELLELQAECTEVAGAVASGRSRHEKLHSELEQTSSHWESLRAEREDRLCQTEARASAVAAGARCSIESKERAAGQLEQVEAARRAAGSRLAAAQEEAAAEVGEACGARSRLAVRREGLASLRSELEEHQRDASRAELLGAKLSREGADLSARLEGAGQAAGEVPGLERRLVELRELRRSEEERGAREELQRRGAGALQRRELEIGQHAQQIGKLEAEQRELRHQAGRLDAERRALEQGLAERAQERRGALEACRGEARECERLEAALREARGLARRLEQRRALRRAVLELEGSLQRLGDRLVEAQGLVRRERAEEEELRLDVQQLQESIRATQDKALYQGEHGNLQFETIQKLEEQKRKFEQELELLTLGLHDAEQRNEFLEAQNRGMQRQVEGLHSGSLQDWAGARHGQVAEVARCRGEVDAWRRRAERARRDRQRELAAAQRGHEEAQRRLRERADRARAEAERRRQAARRREAALARRQERGGAPAGPVPGLVVPQRPLPSGAGRRRALLVGANYAASHAPLKGCVNDVWNLQCLLRYTLRYSEDQLQVLLDSADGRPAKPKRAPTKANVLQGLNWLLGGAQPGDSMLFVFCGYGAQHPRCPRSDEHEAYLVPSDFAADLPSGFFSEPNGYGAVHHSCAPEAGASYRLLPLLELNDWISRLPAGCRMTIVLDCCYSVMPHVSPASDFQPTFPKVDRGRVDYAKFRDFISRPRFLELPVLPVQHTPVLRGGFPSCSLHCFSGCRREEWCAEFPIEGTVQGAFSWAFLKALAKAHFHCGVYQFQQLLAGVLGDLRAHFKAVEQTPLLQLSAAAGLQDVVLWT